jgi:hypothetical protein
MYVNQHLHNLKYSVQNMASQFLKFIFILSIVNLCWSCIKEIDLGVQTSEPIPVLNGLISSLPSLNVVRFSLTNQPNANSSQPKVPTGSKVTFYRNSEVLWEGIPDSSGYCDIPTFTANPDDIFSAMAESSDFATLLATDTVPKPAAVFHARFIPDAFTDEYGDPLPELSVSFADNPSLTNYYELLFFEINYAPSVDSSVLRYYSLPYQPNNILKNEGDQDFRPALYFFSDELFNGQQVDFRVISSAGVLPGEKVKGRPWGVMEDGKYLMFKTVSPAWYKYRKQWTRHYYTQTIGSGIANISDAILDDFQRLVFAPDPIPMFSNVANGLGVFATCNTKIIKLSE